MRRIGTISLVVIMLLISFALSGCENSDSYVNGEYCSEFKGFDKHGYKDFLIITIEENNVTGIKFDGVNELGGFKSEDEQYQSDMEEVMGTNPSKYSNDVINQYLESLNIKNVDIVAGATYSTECFKSLFYALEPSMLNGDTTTVLVDNVEM